MWLALIMAVNKKKKKIQNNKQRYSLNPDEDQKPLKPTHSPSNLGSID